MFFCKKEFCCLYFGMGSIRYCRTLVQSVLLPFYFYYSFLKFWKYLALSPLDHIRSCQASIVLSRVQDECRITRVSKRQWNSDKCDFQSAFFYRADDDKYMYICICMHTYIYVKLSQLIFNNNIFLESYQEQVMVVERFRWQRESI